MPDPNTSPDIYAQIRGLAASDPAFRAELQKNPRAAIERAVSGIVGSDFNLPKDIEIVVVEDTPERIHLVLPRDTSSERELSDAELATVAGGASTRETGGYITIRDIHCCSYP